MTISLVFSFQFLGKLLLTQGKVFLENNEELELNSSKENDLCREDGADF
jgi:hypothetical protein